MGLKTAFTIKSSFKSRAGYNGTRTVYSIKNQDRKAFQSSIAVGRFLNKTPYARHYNPLLIVNRGFRQSEKLLVIQTTLQYKPQLIFHFSIDLKTAPYFPPFFSLFDRYVDSTQHLSYIVVVHTYYVGLHVQMQPNIVQVINYEIVMNFFHISHNLT